MSATVDTIPAIGRGFRLQWEAAQDCHVLLYPEGARTRTGRMGSFIQATRRYLEGADFLVPAAIAGTERAMPVDGEVLEPSSLTLSFGPPVPLAGVDPREALTAAHLAIEDLLPEPLRPDGSAPRLR